MRYFLLRLIVNTNVTRGHCIPESLALSEERPSFTPVRVLVLVQGEGPLQMGPAEGGLTAFLGPGGASEAKGRGMLPFGWKKVDED
jgi:hypothetical protein